VGCDDGLVAGTVADVVFVGSTSRIMVDVADRRLQLVLPNDGGTYVPAPGTAVGIEIPTDAIRVLAR